MTNVRYAFGVGPAFELRAPAGPGEVSIGFFKLERETSTEHTLDVLAKGVFDSRQIQHSISRLHFELQRDAAASEELELAFENGRLVRGQFSVADCQFVHEHEGQELWEVRLVGRLWKEGNTKC